MATRLWTKITGLLCGRSSYSPPRVWTWDAPSGGQFENINRPVAGATHEKELPTGKHPLQLYSLATPNGVKVTVMLEELLALGFDGAEYDAWLIDIGEGEQFGSGFVGVNPNSKIPALIDRSGKTPVRLFESGAILLSPGGEVRRVYPSRPVPACAMPVLAVLANGQRAVSRRRLRALLCLCAGGKFEYPINRYAMEVKRQLDVLDRHLADNRYFCGGEYSIADIAIWPWYGGIVLNKVYGAAEFLDAASYTHLNRWTNEISERPRRPARPHGEPKLG